MVYLDCACSRFNAILAMKLAPAAHDYIWHPLDLPPARHPLHPSAQQRSADFSLFILQKLVELMDTFERIAARQRNDRSRSRDLKQSELSNCQLGDFATRRQFENVGKQQINTHRKVDTQKHLLGNGVCRRLATLSSLLLQRLRVSLK